MHRLGDALGHRGRVAGGLCLLLLSCITFAVLMLARSQNRASQLISNTVAVAPNQLPTYSADVSSSSDPTALAPTKTTTQSGVLSATRSPLMLESHSMSQSTTRSQSHINSGTRSSTNTILQESVLSTRPLSATPSRTRLTASQSPSRSLSATQTRTRFASPGPPVTYAGQWVSVTVSGSMCTPAEWGAVGDGVADDTAPVQSAVSSCAGHGGTVLLPAGFTFLVSGVTVPRTALPLAVVVDGTLRFSDFNTSSRHTGECISVQSSDFVLAGHGLIDGNSYSGWDKTLGSPRLVYAHAPMQRFLIANVTFKDSPFHTLQVYASSTEIVGVEILAGGTMAGTDGVDIHGDYTWVHDSRISVGDDNVAIHASHVLVERCTFGTGSGASIGSLDHEKALQNITVRDSTFDGTFHIAHIKANLHATGFVKDVSYANLKGVKIKSTIAVEMCRNKKRCWKYPGVFPSVYPAIGLNFSNISFINISAVGSNQAGHFICHPTYNCGPSFLISNVAHSGAAPKPWVCVNAGMTVVDSPEFPGSCISH